MAKAALQLLHSIQQLAAVHECQRVIVDCHGVRRIQLLRCRKLPGSTCMQEQRVYEMCSSG